MSTANIERMKEIFAMFKRGEIAPVLGSLTPDVNWGLAGRPQDLPMLGIRQGQAGAGEFFRILDEVQELTAFEPLRYMAVEDKVFGWGRTEWIMRRNGVAGDNDWLFVATFRDDKVCDFCGYLDTAKLTEAYRAAPVKRAANG